MNINNMFKYKLKQLYVNFPITFTYDTQYFVFCIYSTYSYVIFDGLRSATPLLNYL